MKSLVAVALALGLVVAGCSRPAPSSSAPRVQVDPPTAPEMQRPLASLPASHAAGMTDAGALDAAASAWTSSGCEPSASGRTFDVGDGQPSKTLSAVPWARLGPGDVVRIHWRAQPYREKILVSQSGTAARPLRIRGVAGPAGQLPVIDGENATTDRSADYAHAEQQQRGLITLSLRASQTWGDKPRWVVIEGLELRNAGPPFRFTNAAGEARAYAENAACVFVERGDHIAMRHNEVHGCANGLFVASADTEEVVSRYIVIDGNFIYGNGTITNNTKQHSIYTEALGILVQFNRFGPLIEGSLGNQFKDRSVGTVVRYNWFEGGSRAMDLVEPEESYPMVQKMPALHTTYVYGNVVVFGARTSSRPIHYGGDNGTEERYRKGTLYFYDNTIVFTTSEKEQRNVAVLQLQTDDESADVQNNIIYGSGSAHLSWLYEKGTARLGVNWVSRGIATTVNNGGADHTGKIEMLPGGKTITGSAPGFVDARAANFCLLPTSKARHVVGALSSALPGTMLPTLQYKIHQSSAARSKHEDLGAFECD